jgi:hypothetical protein
MRNHPVDAECHDMEVGMNLEDTTYGKTLSGKGP